MDYKKEYEAMVHRARELHEAGNFLTKKQMEIVCPELAESEDERIRKWIVENLSEQLTEIENEVALDYDYRTESMKKKEVLLRDALAWLEKQKEQKPAWQEVKGRRGRIGDTPEHIRKKAENFLSKMEPPYDADDICSAYETGAMENAKPAEWSEEDELMIITIIQTLETLGGRGTTGMQIDWLKSLRPQPKKNCSDCSKNLEGYISGRTDAENKLLEQFGVVIMPEGELRMKPRWKPSEGQMEALERAIVRFNTVDDIPILIELRDKLKKL